MLFFLFVLLPPDVELWILKCGPVFSCCTCRFDLIGDFLGRHFARKEVFVRREQIARLET